MAKTNHTTGGQQHDNISRMMTGNRHTASGSFLPWTTTARKDDLSSPEH